MITLFAFGDPRTRELDTGALVASCPSLGGPFSLVHIDSCYAGMKYLLPAFSLYDTCVNVLNCSNWIHRILLQCTVWKSMQVTFYGENYSFHCAGFLSFSNFLTCNFVRHVEHWKVPKMVLLKQIFKPSRWAWEKKSGG